MYALTIEQLFTIHEWGSTSPVEVPQSAHGTRDASSLLHKTTEINRDGQIRGGSHNKTDEAVTQH